MKEGERRRTFTTQPRPDGRATIQPSVVGGARGATPRSVTRWIGAVWCESPSAWTTTVETISGEGRCPDPTCVAIEHSGQSCACTTAHDDVDSDSMWAYASRRSSRHASAIAATEGATSWKSASRTRIRDSSGRRSRSITERERVMAGAAARPARTLSSRVTVSYPLHDSTSRGDVVLTRTRSPRSMASMATLSLVVLLLTADDGRAQPSPTGWTLSGDVGGAFGGTWLAGSSAPSVSTGTGVAVALGARRRLSSRRADGMSAGVAVRVAAQPVRLREQGAQWDGGTLTDAQVMGTLTIPVDRTPRRRADVEFGAGLAVLSGAGTLYPFSALARTLPTLESGLVLFRSRAANDATARASRPLGLFVRYSMTRVDPAPARADDVSSTPTTAGWAGRVSVGLRVQR